MGGVNRRIIRICRYWWRKKQYASYCFSDEIINPIYLTPKYIELGENVLIWYHARIEGVRRYNNTTYSPRIVIHDNVRIQQRLHLTCANHIIIGENTAIAANVTITDIHHPYDNINIPIEKQDLVVKSVVIGKDCKINNNVVILPGVHIGQHVTIGANSVVTHDIPDFSVAVGNPARVIKRFDMVSKQWLKVQ